MKNLLCLPILLFSGVSLSIAQGELYGGVKGGYVYSNLTSSEGNENFNPEGRNGFSASAILGYEHERLPLGFTYELGYIQKGTQFSQDSLNYKFNCVNTALFMDVIILNRIKLSAGPELGFLLSAKNHVNDTLSHSLLQTYDRRLELSGTLGASVALSFFSEVGFRYNRSFTNIAKYDAILDRRNISTEYFQFYILLKIAN